jgi:hypothetical protein
LQNLWNVDCLEEIKGVDTSTDGGDSKIRENLIDTLFVFKKSRFFNSFFAFCSRFLSKLCFSRQVCLLVHTILHVVKTNICTYVHKIMRVIYHAKLINLDPILCTIMSYRAWVVKTYITKNRPVSF